MTAEYLITCVVKCKLFPMDVSLFHKEYAILKSIAIVNEEAYKSFYDVYSTLTAYTSDKHNFVKEEFSKIPINFGTPEMYCERPSMWELFESICSNYTVMVEKMNTNKLPKHYSAYEIDYDTINIKRIHNPDELDKETKYWGDFWLMSLNIMEDSLE